nr:MAG TPA: hypothetical protein [Caudoviricetes sp.]
MLLWDLYTSVVLNCRLYMKQVYTRVQLMRVTNIYIKT